MAKFKLETPTGKHEINQHSDSVNNRNYDAWFVKSTLSNGVECHLFLPKEWADTRVFQFILSMSDLI